MKAYGTAFVVNYFRNFGVIHTISFPKRLMGYTMRAGEHNSRVPVIKTQARQVSGACTTGRALVWTIDGSMR